MSDPKDAATVSALNWTLNFVNLRVHCSLFLWTNEATLSRQSAKESESQMIFRGHFLWD